MSTEVVKDFLVEGTFNMLYKYPMWVMFETLSVLRFLRVVLFEVLSVVYGIATVVSIATVAGAFGFVLYMFVTTVILPNIVTLIVLLGILTVVYMVYDLSKVTRLYVS